MHALERGREFEEKTVEREGERYRYFTLHPLTHPTTQVMITAIWDFSTYFNLKIVQTVNNPPGFFLFYPSSTSLTEKGGWVPCSVARAVSSLHQHKLTFSFRYRRIIPLIDKNGDGKISVQELAAWTDRSMKGFYKQEAESRLRELDTNKDGKVSWEEYVKGAEKRGGE